MANKRYVSTGGEGRAREGSARARETAKKKIKVCQENKIPKWVAFLWLATVVGGVEGAALRLGVMVRYVGIFGGQRWLPNKRKWGLWWHCDSSIDRKCAFCV